MLGVSIKLTADKALDGYCIGLHSYRRNFFPYKNFGIIIQYRNVLLFSIFSIIIPLNTMIIMLAQGTKLH